MHLRAVMLMTVAGCMAMSCSFKGMLTPMHLDAYGGDGSISRVKYLPNPGVRIEFEKFDLSHRYEADYRLDGLPQRPFAYHLDLVVPYPQDWQPSESSDLLRVSGELTIKVVDNAGTALYICSGAPWWGGTFGKDIREARACFAQCRGLHGDMPYIIPDDLSEPSRLPLTISVAWVPGADPQELKGWFRLQSGGTT